MKIDIISPDKKLFEGECKSLIVPGSEGSLGILSNHAPMIASLKSGVVKLTTYDSKNLNFTIKGGVVEVFKDKVIVLAE